MRSSKKMWERPLVYVAGPYTSPDPVANTHNAVMVGEQLQDTGLVTCYVPHLSLLTHLIAPHNDVEYWYEYDMTILLRCSALYRIPGPSTGADNEVQFALDHNVKVMFEIDDVLAWARDRG